MCCRGFLHTFFFEKRIWCLRRTPTKGAEPASYVLLGGISSVKPCVLVGKGNANIAGCLHSFCYVRWWLHTNIYTEYFGSFLNIAESAILKWKQGTLCFWWVASNALEGTLLCWVNVIELTSTRHRKWALHVLRIHGLPSMCHVLLFCKALQWCALWHFVACACV